MKKNLLGLIILVFSLSAMGQPLNVMTFNIRLNIASDSLNAWPFRKDKVASQVLYHDVHLLGVQEALHGQMMDLDSALAKFSFTGGARDDGRQKGEYSAIFFDTTRLKLLGSETFWLSETPQVPGSKSWDAAITRIVTWAKFRDLQNGKLFYAFNTHFDHIGKEARRESAKLILRKAKEIAGSLPVLLTGDFNAEPWEDPIKLITDGGDPSRFTDSKSLSRTPHYGPTGTFNAFQLKERSDLPIDYIFLKGPWKVLKHAIISQSWGGRFASDHFAVLAKVQL